MLSSRSVQRMRAGERGVYLVVLALCLSILVTLAGLALATGRDYVSQRQTQSAADAASLAGANDLQAEGSLTAVGGEPAAPDPTSTPCPTSGGFYFATDAAEGAALSGFPTILAGSGSACVGPSDTSYCWGTYWSTGRPGDPGNTLTDGATQDHFDVIYFNDARTGTIDDACAPPATWTNQVEGSTEVEVIVPPIASPDVPNTAWR